MKSTFSPKFILVLCEGNHCRSPIAEGLLRVELSGNIRVESAGLGAQDGFPPHPEAMRLMNARGIDITGHRSRQVTPTLALAADLILVMDSEQKKWCEEIAPSARGRIQLLGCWLSTDRREIADPFCKGIEAFTLAFDLIHQSVIAWKSHLENPQKEV